MKEGAEKIRQRILADAQAEAEAIQKEAAAKAANVLEEAKKKAALSQERTLENARKEAEEHKRRILGMSLLEARKEMLAAKQSMIEKVFQEAVAQLSSRDAKDYFNILREMILASAQTGEETVILSPRDKSRVTDGFWKDINNKLTAAGKKGNIGLAAETRDISGGFILQAGGVEINNSFDSLLSLQRDELEPQVARLLFGEE